MAQHEAILKTYLAKYKHPADTKREVIQTITQYRDLRPTFDPFVFNDGTTRQLVQLEGTIPVNYKGAIYNIPISLWVLDTHPYNPPMVFVKPTSTMQIKPGRYVDANGKVELPWIREWKPPNSDLLGLVQMLTITFGEECPVFSRGASGRSQQQPLAYPGSTPYPPANTAGGMPMPGLPGMPGTTPPYPPPTSTAGPGYGAPAGYPPYHPPGGYPGAQSNPPYPGYAPVTQNNSFPTPYSSNPGYPMAGQGYPSSASGYPPAQFNNRLPYPVNNTVGNAAPTNEQPALTPGGTVTEADIRASLLSAVEDKMKRRLKETFAQAQAEMEVLTKTKKDLINGKEKLETFLKDLDREKGDMERNIQLLSTTDKEVKEAIGKMEGAQDIDVDEAVVTTTPLYRQLVDAFAEEQAIEDAIYYLGEGLRKNVIELDSFLKRVRELSRKQFMLRATIQKCREKAGLPPLV